MNRNGKIARLPAEIREQLNVRLHDNEQTAPILEWLNALPEVQRILLDQFDGVPLSKQNLSQWRLGGFREWLITNQLVSAATSVSDCAEQIRKTADPVKLADDFITVVMARYAGAAMEWDGKADPKFEANLRQLHILSRDAISLQRSARAAARQNIELDRMEIEKEEEDKKATRKLILGPILAQLSRESLTRFFGNTEVASQLAEIVTAVHYDLPVPRFPAPDAEAAGTDPVTDPVTDPITEPVTVGQSSSNVPSNTFEPDPNITLENDVEPNQSNLEVPGNWLT